MPAARQAAHVHIQQVKAGLVVMMNALAVLSIALIQRRLAGASHVLRCRLTSVSCTTDCSAQAERALARGLAWVSSQAGSDFHLPVGSGQQADPDIRELVSGRMLGDFLPNLYFATDRAKETLVDAPSLLWLPG